MAASESSHAAGPVLLQVHLPPAEAAARPRPRLRRPMEVQKRVRRFLALHSLLLHAAAPTAPSTPSPEAEAAPCPCPSPASAPSPAASSASRPSTRAASSCATRTPSTSSSTPSTASSTLASPRAPPPPSASRPTPFPPRSPPPSSASASSSSKRPRTTASASSTSTSSAATSASPTISPTPSSYPTPASSASPPISSSSSCPPHPTHPTSPSPPSSAPGSATTASTAPPAPARRTRASRSPSASRRALRSASTSALQFGLWKWQRLPYASPYADVSGHDLRSLEAQRRMEKHAVAAVHELLSLTVEKRTTLERLALFRDALGVPKKIKEFLLKYQGMFYISTRGNQGKLHTVFLREAYCKGELVEPNEIYVARRKLEELLMMSPQKANLDRMFTSMGRGLDEIGGGRRGGAELREEFLGDAGGRKGKVGADGDDCADSGEDSGVESLYIE